MSKNKKLKKEVEVVEVEAVSVNNEPGEEDVAGKKRRAGFVGRSWSFILRKREVGRCLWLDIGAANGSLTLCGLKKLRGLVIFLYTDFLHLLYFDLDDYLPHLRYTGAAEQP